MPDKFCNVFISHIHEDDRKLGELKELLANQGCAVRDSSIHSGKLNEAKDADYIKSQYLAPAINWAGTLLVIVSPKTRESPWVDWEIEYAMKQGKKIVGVWAHGAADCDMPDNLEKYYDDLVGWRGESIVDAIFGRETFSETPSGGSRPERMIPHYRCNE
ncbi:MAG TPA: TIR domain-containing protein [Edaphobacter sp.]|nr:TIR domain-containing protein [Edaphobacter sp.]